MNTKDLISGLDNKTTVNDSLSFIQELLIDKHESLCTKLNSIILFPEQIHDTNKFASLLEHLNQVDFIPNLIEMIRKGIPKKTKWLSDYMYALGQILQESDEYYSCDDALVNLLGDWMLNTNGGEISWKSSTILANLYNNKVFDYLMKGVKNTELFHLTRIECLKRLVNEYGNSKIEFFKSLANDEDKYFKEEIEDALEWLD